MLDWMTHRSQASPIEVASRVNSDGASFAPVAPWSLTRRGRFSIPVEPGPSRVYRIRYGRSEATAEVAVARL